jgi:catechol 2,3-dioxygenase-like lactoylglutathione lyase family enzyme
MLSRFLADGFTRWRFSDLAPSSRKRAAEGTTMTVQLNHTIVPAHDKYASAQFIAEILGNDVTLDYMNSAEFTSQHFAFLVDDEVFDAAYGRLRERGVATWADPDHQQPDGINTRWGGRGVYFPDPAGHNMEILTRAPS